MDQHAGGKGTAPNVARTISCKAWNSPAEYPSWVAKCDIKGSDGTMLNPIFWKRVQGQKHPGGWGIVDNQIPSIKVLFKTNTKSHKHPGIKLLSSESKTQSVNQRKQNSYRIDQRTCNVVHTGHFLRYGTWNTLVGFFTLLLTPADLLWVLHPQQMENIGRWWYLDWCYLHFNYFGSRSLQVKFKPKILMYKILIVIFSYVGWVLLRRILFPPVTWIVGTKILNRPANRLWIQSLYWTIFSVILSQIHVSWFVNMHGFNL